MAARKAIGTSHMHLTDTVQSELRIWRAEYILIKRLTGWLGVINTVASPQYQRARTGQ